MMDPPYLFSVHDILAQIVRDRNYLRKKYATNFFLNLIVF